MFLHFSSASFSLTLAAKDSFCIKLGQAMAIPMSLVCWLRIAASLNMLKQLCIAEESLQFSPPDCYVTSNMNSIRLVHSPG